MARGLAILAAIAVSLLAVAGAGGAGAQAPPRGGTVVGGFLSRFEPACLNPLVAQDCRLSLSWVRQVLEGASEVGPDLSHRPNLVSRVTYTTMPFTLTYHIRPEARWSDGVPVTARDFVFTWHTYSKLELPDFPPAIRNVRALDTKTVRVDFRIRFAGWRDLFGIVLPQHALAGEDPRRIWQNGIDNPKTGDPIGSGPFLVGSFERGRQFTLVRNPRYWGPHQAYLDRMVFRFTPQTPEALFEALRGGTIDWFFGSSSQPGLGGFCREQGITCRTAGQTGFELIAFRLGLGGHDALKQRAVRQAIAYGIDRDTLVRLVNPDFPSLRPLQNSIFLPGQRFYEPHWKVYSHQPAKARRLLEGAGCVRGAEGIYSCSGERLSLRLITTAGVAVRQRSLELIQAQLRQVGIEVRTVFAPNPVLFSQILPSGDFDLAEFAYSISPDPGANASVWRCGTADNWTGYCSRLVTHEFAQSQLIVDEEQRARALNRADEQMAAAVPMLPLVQPNQTATFKGIRGLVINTSVEGMFWNSEDWWRAD